MTLRLGELFAGYGGLGMAVEEVFGAETAWFSEFEEAPSKILAHHWPGVPNHVRGALSAGAVSEMEQSEGRVGDDGNPYLRALGRVLGDLADLGYDAEWRGLTAANVGATHGRFRVFLLASLPDPSGLGLETRRLPGRPATEITQPANHQQVLQNANLAVSGERRQPAPGQTQSGWTRADLSGRSGTPVADPHCGDDDGRFNDPQWFAKWGKATSGRSQGLSAPADTQSLGRPERWTKPARIQRGPHALISGNQNWGEYEPAVRRWERVNGPAPRPTEPTGRNNGHRLSPAFVEWMMGLPAGWVTDVPGVNRNAQLKALGNGVVPQQATAALRDMLAAFRMEDAA